MAAKTWTWTTFWLPKLVHPQDHFWQGRTTFGCQNLPPDQFWQPKVVQVRWSWFWPGPLSHERSNIWPPVTGCARLVLSRKRAFCARLCTEHKRVDGDPMRRTRPLFRPDLYLSPGLYFRCADPGLYLSPASIYTDKYGIMHM